jgi:hypothetical protein
LNIFAILLFSKFSSSLHNICKMAYNQQQQGFDPNQQQFAPEGNGMQGPPPPQQGMQQGGQQGQEGGSPAPFAQQGGVEGSAGSVTGDAKTTLW